MLKKIVFIFSIICSLTLYSQTTIKGKVYNEYLEPFASVSVSTPEVKVSSDSDGVFTFLTKGLILFLFKFQLLAIKHKIFK